MKVVYTEYAGQARQMLASMQLDGYRAVVCDGFKPIQTVNIFGQVSVSGDGLLYEVINGIGDRPDWRQVGLGWDARTIRGVVTQ